MAIRAKSAKAAPAAQPVPVETAPLEPQGSVQVDEGVLMVRRCHYAEGVTLAERHHEERVPTPKFEGEVARTRVSLGVTKNLGGFEFARIDIMVELPCNPNPTDLQETSEFASQMATEFMNRELATALPPAPAPTQQRTNVSALLHG